MPSKLSSSAKLFFLSLAIFVFCTLVFGNASIAQASEISGTTEDIEIEPINQIPLPMDELGVGPQSMYESVIDTHW